VSTAFLFDISLDPELDCFYGSFLTGVVGDLTVGWVEGVISPKQEHSL
jgi:hypothetical protein